MDSRSPAAPRPASRRRPWFWLLAALAVMAAAGSLWLNHRGPAAGSGAANAPPAYRAPAAVQTIYGTWTQVDAKPLQLTGIASAMQGTTFVYTGPETMLVHVVRMRTEASAFEAVQQWRTAPGTAAFYKGGLFIVVSYQEGRAAQAFAPEFLKRLQP